MHGTINKNARLTFHETHKIDDGVHTLKIEINANITIITLVLSKLYFYRSLEICFTSILLQIF